MHEVLSGYAALYSMNPAVILQNRFLNWFPDRNATVNQKRSFIRFQMRFTTMYPRSNVFKLQNGIYECGVSGIGIDSPIV